MVDMVVWREIGVCKGGGEVIDGYRRFFFGGERLGWLV